MPLHVSSTMCSSSGGQKLYYTASGIITPIGGRPVHRLRDDSQHGQQNIKTRKLILTKIISFYEMKIDGNLREEGNTICVTHFGYYACNKMVLNPLAPELFFFNFSTPCI